MSKPRILFINRSYWPDSEVPCRSLTLLCEGLVKEFDVEIISGRRLHAPGCHVASTVGSVRRHGVGIQRVFHTQFPTSSWPGHLLNLPTFLIAAFLAIVWRSPPPDVVIIGTDPPFSPILGRFMKWRYRIPFVAYLQDGAPGIAPHRARHSRLTRWFRNLLIASCNHADRVVVLSEEARSHCIETGIRESIVTIIPHGADYKRLAPLKQSQLFRKEYGLEEKFVVMSTENLSQTPFFDLIIDAATKLKSSPEIIFAFPEEESGKKSLQTMVQKRDLENVRFFSRQKLQQGLETANAHIVWCPPEARERPWPGNFYDLLASGAAIISLSPTDSELSRLVNSEEIGAVCDPIPAATRTMRFIETLRLMAADPGPVRQQGLRARQLCESEFRLQSQVDRWIRLIRKLTFREIDTRKINDRFSHVHAEQEDPLQVRSR